MGKNGSIAKVPEVLPEDRSFTALCKLADSAEAGFTLEEARKELVHAVDLRTLCLDLQRTSELLYVASCGVAGSKDVTLSGKISTLQYELYRASDDAMSAMTVFKETAAAVLTVLADALPRLFTRPPQEDGAVRVLARCARHAETMARTAGELATRFGKLADDANAAQTSTFTERDTQHQARLAAERRQVEIDAARAEAEKIEQELEKELTEIDGLLREAIRKQDTAETRAFALAIVSSITSAISSGVAAYASAQTAPYAAAGAAAAGAASGAAGAGRDGPVSAAAGEGAAAARGKAAPAAAAAHDHDTGARAAKHEQAGKTAGAKHAATNGAAKEAGKAAGAAEETGEAAEAASTGAGPGDEGASASAGTKAGDGAKAAGAPAGQEQGKAKALGDATGKALKEVSDSTQQLSGSYTEIAARWAQAREKYLDLKMNLAKQQREALGAIARYAKEMEGAKTDERLAATAVASLQQAIAALREIVTILLTAKRFWDQMASACKRLASKDLLDDIKARIDQGETLKQRIAAYHSPENRQKVLELATRWYALEVVAQEYEAGILAVRQEIEATYRKTPTIEEAHRAAPELATKLSAQAAADLAKLAAEEREIAQDRANLATQRAASA